MKSTKLLVGRFWALKIHTSMKGSTQVGLEVLIPSTAISGRLLYRFKGWQRQIKLRKKRSVRPVGCLRWRHRRHARKLPCRWSNQILAWMVLVGQHDVLWISLGLLGYSLILFENQIQTTLASPCRIYVTDFVSSIYNLKAVLWATCG